MDKKPPVVVVLGHIDHGKTTLLDNIRKTSITAKEAGGITQSIGAYQVKIPNSKFQIPNSITFIDTPGHEAFSKMRSHGAKAADIAILVIAAEEGVKPQTIEAIKDIQDAKIPFITALNKVDKPEANPQKVKQDLSSHGVFVEGFGGDVPVLEISAKTGKGVKELLELITLMAQVEGLEANPEKSAEGVVIAASRNSRRGIMATCIVKEGTLHEGDWVKLETTRGKIRAMTNFEGERIKEAGPSMPVQIIGLEELPETGEILRAVSSLKEARKEILPAREEEIIEKLAIGGKVVKCILKARETASLAALEKLFARIQTQYPDVLLQVISKNVGDITLSDIDFASEFGAYILGFNVKIPSILRVPLLQQKVSVKTFGVVYDLPNIIGEIIAERFSSKEEMKEKSELTILAIFGKSKEGQVIGGKVTKGTIKKGMLLRIQRGEEAAGKGKLVNLQHLKKDTASVGAGKECGVLFTGDEVKVGDVLTEAF